jgi:hypothetical protein
MGLSFVNITLPNTGSYVNKTMRPLKYNQLGEMKIMRITYCASQVITPLQELMQKLEKNGKNSIEELITIFERISEEL